MLNKEELLSLISKALKVSKKKINMSLKVGDIEEWDSLGHLEILIKIDKMTKGKAAKIKNLSSSSSVKKIYESLKKNKLIK
jgi:acyl carrier protein